MAEGLTDLRVVELIKEASELEGSISMLPDGLYDDGDMRRLAKLAYEEGRKSMGQDGVKREAEELVEAAHEQAERKPDDLDSLIQYLDAAREREAELKREYEEAQQDRANAHGALAGAMLNQKLRFYQHGDVLYVRMDKRFGSEVVKVTQDTPTHQLPDFD